MEILLPTEPLKLVGNFQDGESQKGTYLWRQVSGPSTAKIDDSTTHSIQITNLKTGNYIFEFKAEDSGGLSNSAFVKVNIIDVSSFQHQVLFDKVHWSCPWGCSASINNFFEQLPQYKQGDSLMVFISYNSVWHLIKLTVWDDLSVSARRTPSFKVQLIS
ncbi:PKD domain-containing protein [Solitalea lacus]|uniref:PKD domain-containing protein n=1 Tax=Solitalea lacus TaxID=2911172 RepID=UPI001EDC5F47|nr:hypothetical protein [Solitalea lacus]UKJ08650.1 hypothetical protein L2B55_05645 [Solitalea lacus]